MCLAIPALVRSKDQMTAQVELSGIMRSVSTALTPDVKIGDYVLVHTGYAISVIDEDEARKTLALFQELEGALE